MTKTKSLLTYLLTNSVLSTCVYFGAIQGIPGFMNVVTFFVWFVFVVFVLGAFNEEALIKVYEGEQKRFKLGIVGKLISAIYIGVLVFYGHILLGSIYLITIIISYGMVEKGKKLVEGANS
jgi:hypothetical protein